jgi:hypothetical protein
MGINSRERNTAAADRADITSKIRRNKLKISHIISHNTITHLLRLLNQQMLNGQTTADVKLTAVNGNFIKYLPVPAGGVMILSQKKHTLVADNCDLLLRNRA